MAIYRLNLRAGTGVKPTSPLKGGKSAAKYDYNMREGHYKPKEGEVSDLLLLQIRILRKWDMTQENSG